MKTLPILPQTPPPPLPKNPPRPPPAAPLCRPPFPPPQTWRLHAAKGFATTTGRSKDRERPNKKPDSKNYKDDAARDDKIPDVVWGRMIRRILFYVGVPLGVGLALLQVMSVVQEQGLSSIPKWVPFFTTFITFGASTLGIAYGSLSTSLDAEEKGSLHGFEQVEKNWNEMWEDDDGNGDR